jgi:uncharacterized protein (UPF0332 family)
LIDWKVCEKNFIRKVEVDLERVDSIKKMAVKRYKRIKKEKYSGEEISFLVEGYYEVVKELLVAYLLKNGLRSKNHQCLISYLNKENPELEREIDLIGQMSFFRNRLGYYGEKIPVDFYENRKKEFDDLIKTLLEILNE